MIELNKLLTGDALTVLKTMPDECVNCCITSPPYFGLRDYGHTQQLGLEETPELYISKMVEVFSEVKRMLKNDGTLWVNIGDSYASNTKGSGGPSTKQDRNAGSRHSTRKFNHGIKEKDLIGIPWLLAFALRTDGWYLRQDIIWHKPNPMPESVTDRCTKSHEYIFLLSKSSSYYCDMESIKQEAQEDSFRLSKRIQKPHKHEQIGNQLGSLKTGFGEFIQDPNGANKRSVWTVTTKPYSEAHFATFPQDLIVDMIKAGCPENGIVLDPFMGAGTTALVAAKLNRNYVGIELNPAYVRLAERRLRKELGMFNPSAA